MSDTNEVRMQKRFTHQFEQKFVNYVLRHNYTVTQVAELRQYAGEIRGNTPIASASIPGNGEYKKLKSWFANCKATTPLLINASGFLLMEMNNDK